MRATVTLFCGFLTALGGLAGCGSGYTSKPPTSTALISISATSTTAGSPDLTLTITATSGQFYDANHNLSQAVWFVNGTGNVLATTFVSSTMLTAVVPAALLSNPVTAQVFVKTGDPMGSAVSSNSVFFDVTAAQSSPNISISPTSALLGSSDITLTITGSTGKFDNAPNNLSRAVWLVNGTKTVLTTTFVSSTMLTAVVPAALLSQAVEAEVLVETGAPSGSPAPEQSSPATFSVGSPWDY